MEEKPQPVPLEPEEGIHLADASAKAAAPENPVGESGSAAPSNESGSSAAHVPSQSEAPADATEDAVESPAAADTAQEHPPTVSETEPAVEHDVVASAVVEPPHVLAVYEHPLPVRVCHWLNSFSLVIMAMSGLQIFMAFPSFGPKVPQTNLIHHAPPWLMLGKWLGGALPWHFTFAWIYVVTGIVYVGYQALSGNFRQMLFVPRDIPGVWPMARHYFLFGPKPVATEAYNPLQKIAYTSAIFIGAFSFITGMVLFNPVQFSFLTRLMGGFHRARILHASALAMLGFFIFGHLMMVALHGLNNFLSMITGWKREPEYLPGTVPVLPNQEDTKHA